MRYQFLISAGAEEDLQSCRREDRWAAARIATFLREVSTDQVACEALVDTASYEDGFTVEPLWYLQDKRINAYRVRFVEVSGWRIITAVDHKQNRVAVLGVMARNANYGDDAVLTNRIEQEYDGFGFPRY